MVYICYCLFYLHSIQRGYQKRGSQIRERRERDERRGYREKTEREQKENREIRGKENRGSLIETKSRENNGEKEKIIWKERKERYYYVCYYYSSIPYDCCLYLCILFYLFSHIFNIKLKKEIKIK